jgi:hypothetical protein
MKRFRVLRIPSIAVAVLASGMPALAHRLDAEYQLEGNGFRIEFFTGDGSPASGLVVTAQQGVGEPIEIGKTDEKGIVHFVPPAPGEWTIVGTGGGHSTSRNPLVIQTGEKDVSADRVVAKPQAAEPTASAPASARSNRGRFPWLEVSVSLAFIAILTLITLVMMRRSARVGGRSTEVDRLSHEVDHLRATVHDLRQEIAELKADRESRT